MTNKIKTRALNAQLALDIYTDHVGGSDNLSCDMTNFLVDLMHLAERDKVDIGQVILTAGNVYRSEIKSN